MTGMSIRKTFVQIAVAGRFLKINTKNEQHIIEKIMYIPFKEIREITVTDETQLHIKTDTGTHSIIFKTKNLCENSMATLLHYMEELPPRLIQKLE